MSCTWKLLQAESGAGYTGIPRTEIDRAGCETWKEGGFLSVSSSSVFLFLRRLGLGEIVGECGQDNSEAK